MAEEQFNVILHGMWVIVSNSQCIELIAPESPAHVFDTVIAPDPPAALPALTGSHALTGVARRTEPFRFRRDQALVVDNLQVINRDAVRYSIYLPHPRVILSLRKVAIDDPAGFLSGTHGKRLAPKSIPLVYLLRYNYCKPSELRLDDTALAAANAQGPISLHLFSEPAGANVEGLHERYACKTFDRFEQVLPGLDFRLDDVLWVRAGSAEECNLWERQAAANRAQHPILVPFVIENV